MAAALLVIGRVRLKSGGGVPPLFAMHRKGMPRSWRLRNPQQVYLSAPRLAGPPCWAIEGCVFRPVSAATAKAAILRPSPLLDFLWMPAGGALGATRGRAQREPTKGM